MDDQGKITLPKGVLEMLRRGKEAELVVRVSLAADGSMCVLLKSATAKQASDAVKHRIDGTLSGPTTGKVSPGQNPKVLASGVSSRVRMKAARRGAGKKPQELDDSELKLVDGVPVFDVEVKGGDVVEAIRKMRGG